MKTKNNPLNSGPRGLPDEVIRKLGYDDFDIETIRNVHIDTLEEFRSRPPEMVIMQPKRTSMLTFTDGYKLKIKKDRKYMIDLLSFIDGYHAKMFKPTNKFKNNLRCWKGEDLNNKTVLMWQYGGGAGDSMFVQPILRYIKKIYPKCRLGFMHPARHHYFSKSWDFLDYLYPTPCSDIPFITSDYHIHFDGIIGKCKESETTNIYKLLAKWVNLDIPDSELVPIQKPDDSYVIYCKDVLNRWKLDENFMILQLRANTIMRTPRPEFRLKVLNELLNRDIPIVFVDSPDQKDVINELILKSDKPQLCFNFTPYSKHMGYAAAMTYLSSMVVSVDTGIIHIASALGIPVYGIYGPFPGKIRLETYNKCNWIDAKAECAPCYLHKYSECPHVIDGYSPCYDNINIIDMVEDIYKIWFLNRHD